MPVVDNSKVQEFALPGLTHRTVGGKDGGVKSMEVWQQTIAPGAATPVHRGRAATHGPTDNPLDPAPAQPPPPRAM